MISYHMVIDIKWLTYLELLIKPSKVITTNAMEAIYFMQLVVFIHSMGREMFIETCLVRVHICYILGVIGSQELTS